MNLLCLLFWYLKNRQRGQTNNPTSKQINLQQKTQYFVVKNSLGDMSHHSQRSMLPSISQALCDFIRPIFALPSTLMALFSEVGWLILPMDNIIIMNLGRRELDSSSSPGDYESNGDNPCLPLS